MSEVFIFAGLYFETWAVDLPSNNNKYFWLRREKMQAETMGFEAGLQSVIHDLSLLTVWKGESN
jgi:hypothetical protein